MLDIFNVILIKNDALIKRFDYMKIYGNI